MIESMTIGGAAKQAGVSVETIRFYERKGLIEQPLKPSSGGHRVYSADSVRQLKFIKQAQGLGFSLQEVGELLALRTDPAAECDEVRDRTIRKLKDVDRKILKLRTMRSALVRMIDACPRKGVAADRCTILKSLDSEDLT